MNFQIKHRFNGKVLFEFECGSLNACVEMAVKNGANLDGASLDGANLNRASIGNGIVFKKQPIQILGLFYPVIIFDFHMRIGCKFYSLHEWDGFSDDTIDSMDSMDGNATEFWRDNKSCILSVATSNGRTISPYKSEVQNGKS